MISNRLKGSVFTRNSETLDPNKVIILSVEGQKTERQYFKHISKMMANDELPLPRCVIHLLDKHDHHSDPWSVIELLQDAHALRSGKYVNFFSTEFLNKYSSPHIKAYFSGKLSRREEKEFERDARTQDLHVDRLRELCYPKGDGDVFGIVIDHDARSDLKGHLTHCKELGFNVFLTTPCFELWLLCHFADVAEKYDVQKLFENEKVSNQHTFVSKELSKIAGINKGIGKKNKSILTNKFRIAIERMQKLETDVYKLLHTAGSSVPLLFDIIRGQRASVWESESDIEVASTEEE